MVKFCDVRSAGENREREHYRSNKTRRGGLSDFFRESDVTHRRGGNGRRTGFTASASFVEHGGATRPLIIPFIDWHGPKEGCERVNAVTSNIPASLPFPYFPRPFFDPECSLINETIRLLDDSIVGTLDPLPPIVN